MQTRVPVIVDTDIGSDMDDAFAITAILSQPDLDVQLILTTSGNTRQRAEVLAKQLTMIGRDDIPIGLGINCNSCQKCMHCSKSNGFKLHGWAGPDDLAQYKGDVHENGLAAFADCVLRVHRELGVQVSVLELGPATNLAAITRMYPEIPAKCRVVAMNGSLRKGYGWIYQPDREHWPDLEHNVELDPEATKIMYASWDTTTVPLDTCDAVNLNMEDGSYARFLACTNIEAVCVRDQLFHWAALMGPRSVEWVGLWDVVTALMLSSKGASLLSIETVNVKVDQKGNIVEQPRGRGMQINAALEWNGVAKQSIRAMTDFVIDCLATSRSDKPKGAPATLAQMCGRLRS